MLLSKIELGKPKALRTATNYSLLHVGQRIRNR